MINIAVIDDDETVCGNLKRIIGKYDMKYDYNIRCADCVYIIKKRLCYGAF